MTTTPTQPGTDRASEPTPEWAAVMEVLHAAYDLGMSGDPAETTDPEQIQRRLRLVNACEAASTRLDALAAECERMRTVDERPWSVIDLRDVLGLVITDDDAKYAKDILRKFWVPEVRKGRGLPRTPAPTAATSEEGTG